MRDNKRIIELTDNYIEILRSGQDMDVDEYLEQNCVSVDEEDVLRGQLEEKKAIYRGLRKQKSRDTDPVTVRERIEQRLGLFKSMSEDAIKISSIVSGEVRNILCGPGWEQETKAADVTLSSVARIHQMVDPTERFVLVKGQLKDTVIELTPNRLLVVHVPKPLPSGSKLLLVDSNGRPIEVPVIRHLDRLGNAIYDLTNITELPPFRIQVFTENSKETTSQRGS